MRVLRRDEVNWDVFSQLAAHAWKCREEGDAGQIPDIIEINPIDPDADTTHLLMHPDSVDTDFRRTIDELRSRAGQIILFLDGGGILEELKAEVPSNVKWIVLTKKHSGELVWSDYARLAEKLKKRMPGTRFVLAGEEFNMIDGVEGEEPYLGGCFNSFLKLPAGMRLEIDPRYVCTFDDYNKARIMADLPPDEFQGFVDKIKERAPHISVHGQS